MHVPTVWTLHRCVRQKNRIASLAGRHNKRDPRSHTSVRSVYVEHFTAEFTLEVLPCLDRQRFHSHHGRGHDRRSMSAPGHLTWPMFCPENISHLRSIVSEVLPLIESHCQGIKRWPHHFTRRDPRPFSFVAAGAVASIEGHGVRLDFTFDLCE